MADSNTKYVVMHNSLSVNLPQVDNDNKPVLDDKKNQVWQHTEYVRGDVLEAKQLPQAPQEMERLLRLKAIREAAPDEMPHKKVTLPTAGDLSVSAEAALAGQNRELDDLRRHASQLEQRLMEANSQISQTAVPLEQTDTGAELIRQKDTQLLEQQTEMEAMRRELAELRSKVASKPAEEIPVAEVSEEESFPLGQQHRGKRR